MTTQKTRNDVIARAATKLARLAKLARLEAAKERTTESSKRLSDPVGVRAALGCSTPEELNARRTELAELAASLGAESCVVIS
jgi:hypothetical protein